MLKDPCFLEIFSINKLTEQERSHFKMLPHQFTIKYKNVTKPMFMMGLF